MTCPVQGLEKYLEISRRFSIDLSTGYLFRPVSPEGVVLDAPLSYEATHDRLKFYLNTLGINQGETPHSLRAGCAISMRETTPQSNQEAVMSHVGWRSQTSADHYTRSAQMDQASASARVMANHRIDPVFVDHSTLDSIFK